MSKLIGLRCKVALSMLVASASSVLAIETNGNHVSDVVFQENSEGRRWLYVPILTVSNGSQYTESIFMLDQDFAQSSGKIVSVWYVRDASAPNGWVMKAWSDSDPWNAVLSIKQSRGISNDEDYRWGIKPSSSASNSVSAPESYAKGVMLDDPLAALTLDDEMHDSVVDVLAATTYLSSNLPLETVASGCSAESKAEMIANIATSSDFSATGETHAAAVALANAQASAGCVAAIYVPISTKPMGPAGPWSPVKCVTVNGVTQCSVTREQKFIRKRTCAYGNPTIFCDQWTILTCTEDATCTTVTPTCVPVTPVPAIPNIPISIDSDGNAVPDNCTDGGWVGNSPAGCTCP
jgi:hypothetical protein